jgi:nucleotide-binding universal stress UspA family protein
VEKIVVGIDGSETSKDALRWAVEYACPRRRRRRAAGIRGPVPAPDASPVAPLDLPALVTEIHAGALQFVTEIVKEVVGNAVIMNVAPIAVDDTPAKALLDAAQMRPCW